MQPAEPQQALASNANADARFVEYYARTSLSQTTVDRFVNVKRKMLALRVSEGESSAALDVADIGCGAGTQSLIWARDGHRVRGLDISAPLIELGRQRARQESVAVEFSVGSAMALPFTDAGFDVVLLPELLEHVTDWQACLNEAARILRPGGVLYVSTTNRLCPHQEEYSLPLYSWYPGWLKRRCERMAVTTHGHWVQHTSYPAVHWFTFYQLRRFLGERSIKCLDRFDMIDSSDGQGLRSLAVTLLRKSRTLRFLGHVGTSYTVVFGVKRRIPNAAGAPP